MTTPSDPSLQTIQFYVTIPYDCGYIANKLAQSQIASPQSLVDAEVYSDLIQQGFRRSGKFVYRPYCENCHACIPVRLVLADFKASRSQKRALKQHADLSATVMPVGFQEDHFLLYQAYQQLRHSDTLNGEEKPTVDEEEYKNFLCRSNVESLMIEFKDSHGTVKVVSVVDIVADGISAVYTFYDATEPKASYGTFGVLWLIEWTKERKLPYLYLGYWIEESQKMAYKQNFKPLEQLVDGVWLTS